jgi:hypothetical protein
VTALAGARPCVTARQSNSGSLADGVIKFSSISCCHRFRSRVHTRTAKRTTATHHDNLSYDIIPDSKLSQTAEIVFSKSATGEFQLIQPNRKLGSTKTAMQRPMRLDSWIFFAAFLPEVSLATFRFSPTGLVNVGTIQRAIESNQWPRRIHCGFDRLQLIDEETTLILITTFAH